MTATTRRLPACREIPDLDVLTPYQRSIALLVAEGLHNCEIAHRLGRSQSTIRSEMGNIYARMGIQTASGFSPRVRLARVIWTAQVDEMVATLLEREAA